MVALDQANPWFWIVSVVGAVTIGAVCRWLWRAVISSLKDVLREPVAKAEETAEKAATHAVELKEAIGVPNGRGDLIQMVTRSLLNQERMFEWQQQRTVWEQEWTDWAKSHDAKDDATRAVADATAADVTIIKDHLGL